MRDKEKISKNINISAKIKRIAPFIRKKKIKILHLKPTDERRGEGAFLITFHVNNSAIKRFAVALITANITVCE